VATEILSGPVTGPVWADDGDILIVSKDAIVRSDTFNGALENRTSSDDGISILVDGKIRSTGDYGAGIRMLRQAPDQNALPQEANLVQVRDGGLVTGFVGIDLIFGKGDAVDISGRVVGEYAGIRAEAGSVSITNSGTIVSTASAAVLLESAAGSTITNSGKIVSDGVGAGIWMQDSDATVISNSGRIAGAGVGIEAVSTQDFNLINTGAIVATADTSAGVKLIGSNDYLLRNMGTIKGDVGLELSSGSGVVYTSGKIAGQSVGMKVLGDPGEMVVVDNTGMIKGAQSFAAFGGPVQVTNTGTMEGDFDTTYGGQTTLVNGGWIIGAVKLGAFDDVYRATGDGGVSRFVSGGGGADRLTGGTGADDLRGGKSADALFGKAGQDQLQGGGGRDLLKGGADNDILTGGNGADVFVFGSASGTDIVTDFETGKDLLRLVSHGGGFEALSITDAGADLAITHDGGVIVLAGAAGTTLTPTDFDFV
jgi:Ca2+-binding RTX toxin-like protein